jgi:8-oxo-dGTP diphosphatase
MCIIKGLKGVSGDIEVYLSPEAAEDLEDVIGGFVIPFEQGRLLMCKHLRRDAWEFPGGRREPGETSEACIRREAQEEAGIRLKGLRPLGYYTMEQSGCRKKASIYTAEVDGYVERPEWTEMGEIGLFDSLPDHLSYRDGVYEAALEHIGKCTK